MIQTVPITHVNLHFRGPHNHFEKQVYIMETPSPVSEGLGSTVKYRSIKFNPEFSLLF